jgi:hypothetical protein
MAHRFVHRTLKVSTSQYERALSAALLKILGNSIHDLAGIVAALNKTSVKPQNGASWTEATFVAEMERLGAYPNSTGAPLGGHPPGIVPSGTATVERPKRAPRGESADAH